MPAKHVAPEFRLDAFNCPHCGAFAKQTWGDMMRSDRIGGLAQAHTWTDLNEWSACHCARCDEISLWRDDQMLYPLTGGAPDPHSDMHDSVRIIYEEARSVVGVSPRSAVALLRLALQQLTKELGQPGNNLNDEIGALVAGGLDTRVQKALDSVRIIGNNTVHPGQIDVRDNREIANRVFTLLNIVVEEMVTKPALINGTYGALPEGARKGVERRDRP